MMLVLQSWAQQTLVRPKYPVLDPEIWKIPMNLAVAQQFLYSWGSWFFFSMCFVLFGHRFSFLTASCFAVSHSIWIPVSSTPGHCGVRLCDFFDHRRSWLAQIYEAWLIEIKMDRLPQKFADFEGWGWQSCMAGVQGWERSESRKKCEGF